MNALYAITWAYLLAPQNPAAAHHLNLNPVDMKWEKILPELGADSPEITMLRVDPSTQATHLMIRVPENFHVPQHWHTANETHTVIEGTFIIEAEGKRQALKRGGFNYVPSKMAHEAWTTSEEGTLLLITVDGAWDLNFVNGPPKRDDMVGKGIKASSKSK
jgi:mannose-6-phosphate isomerase-like protein (cupin superfamily)